MKSDDPEQIDNGVDTSETARVGANNYSSLQGLETAREELRVRRGKRDSLRERGIDPYPCRFSRKDVAKDIKSVFRDDAPTVLVATAGRVRSVRGHGKACFATIEDETDTIQIHLKKDVLGERYDLVKFIDLGDFVGVRGKVFRTRMGEITVEVAELEILSKALEPLPSKWHGLADIEIRYRRRYLDLIANPEVRDVFRKRSVLVAAIRHFLTEKGFMEVETPMMQTLAGGAAARPFVTHHNTLDLDLFLRIAPELYLKRLIVGGFEKVFELNRNFRNEGMDRHHNPEFTMIEVYEAYADYNTMMDLTESLILSASLAAELGLGDEASIEVPVTGEDATRSISLRAPWRRVCYFDAIVEGGGPRLEPGDCHAAIEIVKTRGIESASLDYVDCLDAIFEKYAEPLLWEPTFVLDYPTIVSPLAKRKPGAPDLVERFELYIAGMEIANAFTELNDPDDQEERFRAQSGPDGVIDEDYVAALRVGMPPTGGMGLGIDRLVMLLCGQRTLRDVILFPTMRP